MLNTDMSLAFSFENGDQSCMVCGTFNQICGGFDGTNADTLACSSPTGPLSSTVSSFDQTILYQGDNTAFLDDFRVAFRALTAKVVGSTLSEATTCDATSAQQGSTRIFPSCTLTQDASFGTLAGTCSAMTTTRAAFVQLTSSGTFAPSEEGTGSIARSDLFGESQQGVCDILACSFSSHTIPSLLFHFYFLLNYLVYFLKASLCA